MTEREEDTCPCEGCGVLVREPTERSIPVVVRVGPSVIQRWYVGVWCDQCFETAEVSMERAREERGR